MAQSIADRLRALEHHLRASAYRPAAIAKLRSLADEVERLEHAVTYALNAIDEHMVGTDIDWPDVRRVLAKAMGEDSHFDHPSDCPCFICAGD